MNDSPKEIAVNFKELEQMNNLVNSEFVVEEHFIEHGTPIFQIRKTDNLKHQFLRLIQKLESPGFVPILREEHGKTVIRIVKKPTVKPSRSIINILLFLATIGTTLLTGYFISLNLYNTLIEAGELEKIFHLEVTGQAATFTIAIIAILGCHEMGHKLAADRHSVDATFPYFIPGPPPQFGGFGTFGAVIKQKSLAPNKDALFDIGACGPVAGFIVAVIVTAIGIYLSPVIPQSAISNGNGLPVPLLFEYMIPIFSAPISKPSYILIHPVAFAGWIGMLVTMLNLLPTGMLDGGHVIHSLIGRKAKTALTLASILILFIQGPMFYMMIILLLFLSSYRDPDPLDNISKLSNSRKLATLALIAIFVLCLFPFQFSILS
jgi:membrane-associated protease RseP (regulator of RpoE activity)